MAGEEFAKLLSKLAQKYDTPIGSMESLGDGVQSISTRNTALDAITGVGGLPLGRTIELFGPPSSGKTTLALQVAAEAQSKGIVVAYADFEQAMDRAYAQALGVDIENIQFFQPNTFEDGADISLELIKSGYVGLLIFDSVAAMTPAVLLETETAKQTVALQARLMADFTKKLNPLLRENLCTAVFLNHVRDKFGVQTRPGMPVATTTPGGMALKFYASMRIEFKARGNVLEEAEHNPLSVDRIKDVTASKTLAKVVKNKVGPPHREALLRMYHGKGFSEAYSVLQIFLAHKLVLKKPGGIFSVKEAELEADWMDRTEASGCYVKGEANLLRALEEDAEVLGRWSAAAVRVLAGDTVKARETKE